MLFVILIILLMIWIARRRQTPEPHINIELPHFGFPDSEISHTEVCHARIESQSVSANNDFDFNPLDEPQIDNPYGDSFMTISMPTATIARPNRVHIFTRDFV